MITSLSLSSLYSLDASNTRKLLKIMWWHDEKKYLSIRYGIFSLQIQ